MVVLSIINLLVAAFLGYIIGRFGDNYINFWIGENWLPHHWIYGLLMIIFGILFFKGDLQLWIISFGVGLFVSDLKDFLDLKFFAPDGKTKETRRFWHID